MLRQQAFKETACKNLNYFDENIRIECKIIIVQISKYMESDSVHFQIERQVRGRATDVPADYVTAMRKARTNPVPYNITYLDKSLSQLRKP